MTRSPPPSPHLPERPGWTCRLDRRPWPCRAARRELRHHYRHDPMALALYMAARLVHAVRELDDPPERLARRFLSWTRRSGIRWR